ncbi:B3 domain-containing transcription factor VRN1-like protein, partial [Drosera capensis]
MASPKCFVNPNPIGFKNGRQIQDDAKAGRRGRPCSSSLTGGKPHFFKIIISSIQHKQLRIPPKFAKKYGKDLSKKACLTVPNGTVWKVDIVKSGDVIRLSSGWDKFMENFSIKLGHFLVFRYEGNSCFYVLVFDMSASEIKYATLVRKVDNETDCNVGATKEVGMPMKMLDESASKKISGVKFLVPKSEETEADVGNAPIEISDDSPSCSRKRKQLPTTPYPRPCSKKRKEAPPRLYGGPTGLPIPRMGVKHKAKESVLRKAEAFQSRSPCFMVIMPKSSVSDSHPLRIPTSYGHKYLLKEHSKSISLKVVGNNKRWRMSYSIWNCGSVVINCWKRVPPRFSRKYGKELSSIAQLAVATGAMWDVELVVKSDQPASKFYVKEEEKVDSHDSDSNDDEASVETLDDSDDDDVSLEILDDSSSRTTSTSEIETDNEDTKDETSVKILDDSVSSSRKRKEPDEDTKDETSVEILDYSASSLRKRKEPPSTSIYPKAHSGKYLVKKENKIITLQTVCADKTWRTR